jgi:hypothetical protein
MPAASSHHKASRTTDRTCAPETATENQVGTHNPVGKYRQTTEVATAEVVVASETVAELVAGY